MSTSPKKDPRPLPLVVPPPVAAGPSLLPGKNGGLAKHEGKSTLTLSILIPVYNERATIAELLRRVDAVPLEGIVKEVVVADDGSSDGTRDEVDRFAKEHPELTLKLLVHPQNRGKGAAVRTALEASTGDLVLIQDGDLEYNPADYPVLLAPLLDGRADAVFGSRFLGGPHRVLFFWHSVGNKVLTTLSNVFTNYNLTDMEVCYKAMHRHVAVSLHLVSDRFGIEPEITAKLARGGFRLYEVPGELRRPELRGGEEDRLARRRGRARPHRPLPVPVAVAVRRCARRSRPENGRSMRVAITHTRYCAKGGVERYIWDLVKRLCDAGHEVHYFCHFTDGQGDPRVKVHKIPNRWKPIRFMKVWSFDRWLTRHVRRDEWDVIHGFSKSSFQDIYTDGSGCLLDYQAHSIDEKPEGDLKKAMRRASLHQRQVLAIEERRFTRGNFSKIVTMSDLVAKQIKQRYGLSDDEVVTIYNGIDIERFVPSHRAAYGATYRERIVAAPDCFVVLCIGNDYRRKGIPTLIEAARLLKSRGGLPGGRPFRFAIVGKERYQVENEMSAICKKVGVYGEVKFYGPRTSSSAGWAWPTCSSSPRASTPSGTSSPRPWPPGSRRSCRARPARSSSWTTARTAGSSRTRRRRGHREARPRARRRRAAPPAHGRRRPGHGREVHLGPPLHPHAGPLRRGRCGEEAGGRRPLTSPRTRPPR
jgi:glycosyltransferase involved in cell wall biosynthesis